MKYLILGDGLLGSEIIRQSEWNYISIEKDNFDFTNINSYRHFLKDYNEIINCVGYIDTYSNDKAHWDINYKSVIDLVDLCNLYNKKLIHISTDYLYANSKNNASEEDIPLILNNWYSYTKLLADGYIQAKSQDYLIIRTSFKPRPFPWKEAWKDLIGNFDYVDIIANLIIKLIKKGAEGIYNVGTEKKSMYDLAIQTVPDCKAVENDNRYNRPYNITMNLNKLTKILNGTKDT